VPVSDVFGVRVRGATKAAAEKQTQTPEKLAQWATASRLKLRSYCCRMPAKLRRLRTPPNGSTRPGCSPRRNRRAKLVFARARYQACDYESKQDGDRDQFKREPLRQTMHVGLIECTARSEATPPTQGLWLRADGGRSASWSRLGDEAHPKPRPHRWGSRGYGRAISWRALTMVCLAANLPAANRVLV
jgi:hypothetical protein